LKDLWRRSTAILWASPIVWVPVVCADLLSFAVKTGNAALNRRIALSLLQAQHASVLSQPADMAASHISSAGEAALLVAATDLGTQLLTTCLYAMAAIVTWSVVQTLVGEPRPELGPTIRSAGAKGWNIFGLTLLAFAITVCFAMFPAVLLGLAIPLLHLARRDWPTVIRMAGFGEQLLGYVVAAYWITPPALRLMQPDGRAPIARERLTDARLFAAISVAASLAIGFLCQTAERAMVVPGSPDHAFARVLVGAGASLLSALPYVLLFLFLSLAACEAAERASDGGEPVMDTPADA